MDITTRFVLGALLLTAIQMVVSTTAVFLVRRWKRVTPTWSWLKTLGAFALLVLVVTAVAIVPVVGRYAAIVVSLVGLKRISQLDILSTFILSFSIGVSLFVVGLVISNQFQVDLLGLDK